MYTRKLIIFISIFLYSGLVCGQEFMPENILELDQLFGHHVIVAEKSTHSLYLFSNKNGEPELVHTYQVATGKKSGNKIFQGDHRTPEGVYYFNQFLTHKDLLKRHGPQGEIYGVGAFVMNYPNPIDIRRGKTGSGIWLHSTNDETRIEKGLDSRGCVVAHNHNLIEISKYLELHRTNFIVVQDLKFLPRSTWEKRKTELKQVLVDWSEAWKNENFDAYISYYHPTEFQDPLKGSYNGFRSYKRAVFANPGTPNIEVTNINIFVGSDYAVATFKQLYRSTSINDVGKKILYFKRDEYYNWKIVAESWSKDGITGQSNEDKVAFQPSMRFFESQNPSLILGDKLIVVPEKNN